ncbi:MAG: hypothetical protein AAFW69_04735 [Pseudomonadota bacterium]
MAEDDARSRRTGTGLPREFLVAGGVSVLWTLTIGAYLAGFLGLFGDAGGGRAPSALEIALIVLGTVLPLALIWLLAILARQIREGRAEAARLAAALGRIGEGGGSVPPAADEETLELAMATTAKAAARQAVVAERGRVEEALARLEARQERADAALSALLEGRKSDRSLLSELSESTARAARRGRPPPPRQTPAQVVTSQPGLPLEPEAATAGTPDLDDIVAALNFPRDAEDREGFRAMGRATRRHDIARLIQAAEDVLTLLAGMGIYMDDLRPGLTDPALWRRFAGGERGGALAPLGAIEDEATLETVRLQMRGDQIFRDAALHFLRLFDGVLEELCGAEDDALLHRLADTRSARAFMILARVGGSFD